MKAGMTQFSKLAQSVKRTFINKTHDPQAFHIALLDLEQFCRNWRMEEVRKCIKATSAQNERKLEALEAGR